MHEALALILSTAKKIKEKKRKGAERKGELALLPQFYTACQGDLSKGKRHREALLHLQCSQGRSRVWGLDNSRPTLSRTQTAQVFAVTTEIPNRLGQGSHNFYFCTWPTLVVNAARGSVLNALPVSFSRTHSHTHSLTDTHHATSDYISPTFAT